jgi:predicted AlkP superfamily phosphohydrolase/phosphomutase
MCAICQLPTSHTEEFIYASNLLKNPYILNYIDPGSGYVLGSNLAAIIGILLSGLASLLFFFRSRIFPFFKKKFLIVLLVALGIIGIVIMFGMVNKGNEVKKKVIVIGFDGMDPKILAQGFAKGLFPNLKKLADTGYFSTLETTVPPQSPVAWASFITGEPPSKHGMYDFIERDPKDYSLNLVFSDQDLNKENRIKATPFWERVNKAGIPVTILFLPDTFDPPKSLSGELISGMGVPDILGTQGTFQLFTTKNYPTDNYSWRGRVTKVKKEDKIVSEISGPKYSSMGDTKTTSIPVEFGKKTKDSIEVKVAGKSFALKKGEFSEWVRLEFKIDFFTRVRGIAKFYVKSVVPDFEIYMTPINFDPEAPLKPISSPRDFSAKLSSDLGKFSTLGLPHDTWALEENVFDEEAFLKQAESILSERKNIYYSKLDKFRGGLFVAYFGMPDTISHMFWRFKDKGGKYGNTINEYYKKMDEIVGKTLTNMPQDTVLYILSDHGFYSFDYEMNINSWLKENGYLTLKEGTKGGPLYENVDWSKTRAYAAGYNSVFLNIDGREKEGIVKRSEVQHLLDEIIEKLAGYNNPETGENVIKKVYTGKDLGISQNDPYAPDMILGFYKGTRASWDSAIGAAVDYTIRKREGKWSGDHLFDPSEVPGVLLSNKRLKIKDPGITDVVPEALKSLGI